MSNNLVLDPVAGAVFNDLADAFNASVSKHQCRVPSALVASNQLQANMLAWAAKQASDPQAFIDQMIEGLRERVADIMEGREPCLLHDGAKQ